MHTCLAEEVGSGAIVIIMSARQLSWSIVVLIWVNALPYLSRLPRGLDWAAQYLPDDGWLVFGLIFSHALFSAPAVPLIKSLRESERPGLFWGLALLAVTLFTWVFNKDFDLAADAQAATGLVIFPLMAMGAAYGILALGRKFQNKEGETAHQSESTLEAAIKKARQSPGWLGSREDDGSGTAFMFKGEQDK